MYFCDMQIFLFSNTLVQSALVLNCYLEVGISDIDNCYLEVGISDIDILVSALLIPKYRYHWYQPLPLRYRYPLKNNFDPVLVCHTSILIWHTCLTDKFHSASTFLIEFVCLSNHMYLHACALQVLVSYLITSMLVPKLLSIISKWN